ncbi:6785_t:CDS:2 [Acaulospora colombiana]|uniref:6785_t:CDS:1 n=1 Tax=Acaulospora colombiana TaxID=27376 RepID=A0ACA9LY60_9GLOM|nr:6785_t:CDS:2 [Acaulospora colombiana]
MHEYLIKESSAEGRPDLLFLGEFAHNSFIGKMGHLACFVPGMLAIGSKILDRPKDLETAKSLAETCYWLYNATETGIGPEEVWLDVNVGNKTLYYSRMSETSDGIFRTDNRYLLRPVTGDKEYQEKGWKIWESIEKWCKTPTAYSGLYDVTSVEKLQNDNMER